MKGAYIRSVMNGQRRSMGARAIRCGLAALAPVYGVGARGRNLIFDLGLRRPKRLDRPVISVGNLTVGGTGKTPMVLELVCRLKAMGQQPAVLMRGYGACSMGSDEATLLSEQAAVPVVAQADRSAAGSALLAKQPQVSLFVLDDAFQHRQLHRDLNLLLIDATEPFGFRRLLPRGLLREPVRGARRADAVIVTHAEQVGAAQLTQLDQRIEKVAGMPPVAHAAVVLASVPGTDTSTDTDVAATLALPSASCSRATTNTALVASQCPTSTV